MLPGQAGDDKVEGGVGDEEQLLDAGGDQDPAGRIERPLVQLTTHFTVVAHRDFVNVDENAGKVAEKESCGEAEERDVEGSLLAADVAVGDVAAVVGRVLLLLLLRVIV